MKTEHNKLSNQLRCLEVKNRDRNDQGKGKSQTLDEYATKLKIKQIVDEERYEMKISLAEEKKEREKRAHREQQSELQSQIAISGGRLRGFGPDVTHRNHSNQDFMWTSSSSTSYFLGPRGEAFGAPAVSYEQWRSGSAGRNKDDFERTFSSPPRRKYYPRSPIRRSPCLSRQHLTQGSSSSLTPRSNSVSSLWTMRQVELQKEARNYARSAPQLRNRLTLGFEDEVEVVEGTQMPEVMPGTQLELDIESPTNSESSRGLEILSQTTGVDTSTNGGDNDEDNNKVEEQSQELL